MEKYLNYFLTKYSFSPDAKISLTNDFKKLIGSSKIKSILENAIKDYKNDLKSDLKPYLEQLKQSCCEVDVHEYSANLIFFILLFEQLNVYYLENGYSQKLFDDSALDIRYKLEECFLVKGIYGTFVPLWYFGFLTLEKFTLNRLQFRIIKYPVNKTIDGVYLDENTEFIDVHIPRSGARLDHDEVLKSYDLAVELFTNRFGLKKPIFFCSSWLLYPDNLKVLSPNSNLAQFIKDFTVVSVNEYKDYSDVWRLFDKDFDGNADNLPADSSLRRAYIDWIKQGKKTGGAIGVFVYKK